MMNTIMHKIGRHHTLNNIHVILFILGNIEIKWIFTHALRMLINIIHDEGGILPIVYS